MGCVLKREEVKTEVQCNAGTLPYHGWCSIEREREVKDQRERERERKV